jgi:hypothetical protein
MHNFTANVECPITKYANHSGHAVQGMKCLALSKTGIAISNPTRGMYVCVNLFCVYVVLYRQRPCDWVIPRPGSPTDCLRLRK